MFPFSDVAPPLLCVERAEAVLHRGDSYGGGGKWGRRRQRVTRGQYTNSKI